jgi:hypothetical protein
MALSGFSRSRRAWSCPLHACLARSNPCILAMTAAVELQKYSAQRRLKSTMQALADRTACRRQVWLIGGLLLLNLVPLLGTYCFGIPELRSTAAIAAVFGSVAVAPPRWLMRRECDDAAAADGVHGAVDGASAAPAPRLRSCGVRPGAVGADPDPRGQQQHAAAQQLCRRSAVTPQQALASHPTSS